MRSIPFAVAFLVGVTALSPASGQEKDGRTQGDAGRNAPPAPSGRIFIDEPPPIPDDVYEDAIRQQLPGSPEQIRRYRRMRESVERAKNDEVLPAVPITSTTVINPAVKTDPPVLRLRIGYSTTLVFRDANGAPFKVEPVGFGDNKAYKVHQIGDNTLILYATQAYRPSNMTVMLDGEDTPLVIRLTNGGTEVDFVRVFSIARLSPASREKLALSASQSDPVPVVNDEYLTRFLDGIIPAEAQVIPVLESGVDAWWFRNRVIVRTGLHLLSPEGTPLHGTHGRRVYEILSPVPILIFSDDQGKEVVVHLVLDQIETLSRNQDGTS